MFWFLIDGALLGLGVTTHVLTAMSALFIWLAAELLALAGTMLHFWQYRVRRLYSIPNVAVALVMALRLCGVIDDGMAVGFLLVSAMISIGMIDLA